MWLVVLVSSPFFQPVYESKAAYGIGPRLSDVEEIQRLEGIEEVRSWLYRHYPTTKSAGQAAYAPHISGFEVYAKGEGWIKLAARAPLPAESQNFLTGVVDTLFARHQAMYQQSLLSIQRKISVVDGQLNELRHQLQQSESAIDRQINANPAAAVLNVIRQEELAAQIEAKKREARRLNGQARELALARSEVLAAPSLPSERVAPDIYAVFSMCTVLGLIVGWIAAVVRWGRLRTGKWAI